MDERQRETLRRLRLMSSGKAADALLADHPPDGPTSGEAIRLIAHLSWSASDQVRLAHRYLSDLPVGGAWPYEAFATIMPARRLVGVLAQIVEDRKPDGERRALLDCHVAPALRRAAKTPDDQSAITAFLARLRSA